MAIAYKNLTESRVYQELLRLAEIHSISPGRGLCRLITD